jgi:alpha-tubulin suppressor-like RCC1 family protein
MGNFMRRQITILILTISSLTLSGQILDGGNGHALIIDKQGHVWTIGRNNYGQLGDSTLKNSPIPKKIKSLNDIVVISRGYDHSIALNKNGNLFLWGRNNYGQLGCTSVNDQLTPQKLPNHTNFVAVEGGHWHTVGLKKTGQFGVGVITISLN